MSRLVLAVFLIRFFLQGLPLTGQSNSPPGGDSANEGAPRKVRPLPAGAVPVNPPPKNAPSPPLGQTQAAPPQAGPPRTAPVKSAQEAVPAAVTGPTVRAKTSRTAPIASQGTSASDDRTIEAAIRAKLAKSKIGLDGFTVHVQGGVAFWEGQTGVVQHKGAATRMARTAGARQVVNNIRISEAAKQQAMANLDQGRRRDQTKRSEPRSQ